MHELFLNEIFRKLWQDRDPFEGAFELTGESYRKVKSRHTFRIEIDGQGYFVKLHRGCGLREYLKNLLQFKNPVTGAFDEYHALRHLEEIGVDTMTPAAYGCRGLFPPYRTSFLITEELTDCISLEDYCREWQQNPPDAKVKYALIRQLGNMTGKMHRSGLNHRDCYICHFLLKRGTELKLRPELHVIDLHRAEIRSRVPMHYLVKDLAGLWFSSMDAGLTGRDVFRFLRTYFDMPLHQVFAMHHSLLNRADHTARKLYRKEHGKECSVKEHSFVP